MSLLLKFYTKILYAFLPFNPSHLSFTVTICCLVKKQSGPMTIRTVSYVTFLLNTLFTLFIRRNFESLCILLENLPHSSSAFTMHNFFKFIFCCTSLEDVFRNVIRALNNILQPWARSEQITWCYFLRRSVMTYRIITCIHVIVPLRYYHMFEP